MKIPALLIAFLSPVLSLSAGTSANYSTRGESIGAGGGPATSARYSVRACSGAESGSLSTVGPYRARHGFAGQLYAAVQVDFYNEDSADEGVDFQLLPSALLDDNTRVEAATLFRFTNLAPLYHLSFSPVAEVSLGNVHEETWTPLRVSFEDVSNDGYLIIRDVDPDNFGIYAHDGLPDWWQVLYFGENQPAGLAGADPDGDSHDNQFEYHAQIIPNDPSSRFHQWFRLDGIVGNIIYGPVRSGTRYQVWWSYDMMEWRPLVGEIPEISGGYRTDFDPDAVTEPPFGRRFYKVEVSRD